MTEATRLGWARLVAAAGMAAGLVLSGAPAGAEPAPGPAAQDAAASTPVMVAESLWDGLRGGAFGVLDYGALVVRSVSGWVTGTSPGADEAKADDVRNLLSLSDKEFRDFDALVRTAGYELQGYSFGVNGASEVELGFDFVHTLSEREQADLRRQLDQQGSTVSPIRRTIVAALLDASRYVDAAPASGYRLVGVSMRLSTPPDVRLRFQRVKP